MARDPLQREEEALYVAKAIRSETASLEVAEMAARCPGSCQREGNGLKQRERPDKQR